MNAFIYFPMALQGCAIAVDEFYYHRRRGLERWERLGHPLDTLTVFVAYAFLALASTSAFNLIVFIIIATFSSIFVTKDEWIHAEVCVPGEQWLHAVLFLLHPTTFFAAGWLWWREPHSSFFIYQSGFLLCFALYQFFYWRVRAAYS